MRLEVKNLEKSFKSEKVLQDINLDFTDGRIYGIIGRNGSGKSVLFKIICGFMHADGGTVSLDGKIIGKDIDFPENMGAIIENPGFLWYQSGLSNLDYLAGIRKKVNKAQVKETMRLVGLNPDSKKWVGKYSLGMKQRLSIAQAIMENPDLIVLDEPMNGLDEQGVAEMRELFLKLKEEHKLILMASHNREDIDMLCDEVYHIEKGKIEKVR